MTAFVVFNPNSCGGRTGIGQFGPPSKAAVEKVAAQMAATLGWDADKTAREIDGLAPLYRTQA